MSKSKQEEIDPVIAVAQEEKKRKVLLFSFPAKFIAAVGSTEGSRNSCLLTDAIALFDKDWDEGINFYVREIGCKNIPELVQLLKNKVKIFMDAQRRWWVNVLPLLRTDVNGHILDRVDSANERNRIENYNRSTRAGKSTTNYIPLKNEQAFRDFRRGRLSLSSGYLEPNPFNRSAPPAPARSQNRSVPPAPARDQKQPSLPVPAQNTNQTKYSNRARRRSRQRQQYERPRAFSSSAAKNGSNSSSNTSLFISSMPPPPQPLKQKQQPYKPNNTTLTQSDENKQTEVVAAELIGIFSNSSLGPANSEAKNGVNVPAVSPVKYSTPTACISNNSIDSTRAEPAATNGVNSPVNIAQRDEKEKKAKFAEEMLASENELSDRLGQFQISAKDQPVAPTKPAFSLPMKRTIEMDTSVLDALEAPLPGADDDIEIRAPLPHVDDEIEVDW